MRLVPLTRFTSQALHDLFDEQIEQWAMNLRWDYSDHLRIICNMMDLAALPGFVALEDGMSAGYAFYVEEGSYGIVGDCFVSKKYAGQGIEERLLGEIVETLKKDSRINRIESQFINFRKWPVESFFEKRGFKCLERYFMLRNCNSLDLRMLPPVGIELRPWEETNLDDAAQLTVHAYENIVDREISIHYESFDGCRNYLRNIISKLGCGSFVKNASFCALHLHSKQWIGFVLTSSVSSFNGHIPQVVVSPEFQGRGIGAHLLIRSIVALSTQQYRTISLSVTAKNKGAVTLYQRLNFNTLIRFHAAAWSRCGPA